MGKHVYLTQRTDSNMAVVIRMEELMNYVFRITVNEKQFPKAYRYTLSNDLREACLSTYKAIYKATYLVPKTEKEYQMIFDYQQKALEGLLDIKALIVSTMKITKIRNPGYLAKLFENVVNAYRHWKKNVRRNYNRFQKNQKMTPEEKKAARQASRDSWLHYRASILEHDDEGFVKLKKRPAPPKTKEERLNDS